MAEQLTETFKAVLQKLYEGTIPECLVLHANTLLQAGTPTPIHSIGQKPARCVLTAAFSTTPTRQGCSESDALKFTCCEGQSSMFGKPSICGSSIAG
jgi:hypothetical protein